MTLGDVLLAFLEAIRDGFRKHVEQKLIGPGFGQNGITIDHSGDDGHEAKDDRAEKPFDHEGQFGSYRILSRQGHETG